MVTILKNEDANIFFDNDEFEKENNFILTEFTNNLSNAAALLTFYK